MKIKKIKQILNIQDNNDFADLNFAQSPQTLEFQNFIRIYFSTRTLIDKKYISKISFIDVEKETFKLIGRSKNEVISQAELGSFDEHGIFPLNILKANNRILGFSTGWSRRKSVSVETGIGLLESFDDGLTFQRVGNGPIVSSSSSEPFLVGDAFVIFDNGKYKMWYIFGTSWEYYNDSSEPERMYKIGYSESKNLLDWSKNNGHKIIYDSIKNECQALPTVININNTYHMFFCYRHPSGFRQNGDKAYKIAYSKSIDGINWDKRKNIFFKEENELDWDYGMKCYPHIFKSNNKFYLLYNGNSFGKFGFGVAEVIFD